MSDLSDFGSIEQPHEEAVSRVGSPGLDAVLGKAFKVLDDGFVRAVDYQGADASIVQAARVSYGAGTRHVHEDRGLIRYLMRHRHSTPFEMADLKLHVRVPMDAWRQWIRHRTASINEYSTRYSLAIDRMQETPADAWRLQATGNRQGSEGRLPSEEGIAFTRKEQEVQQAIRDVYTERIERGIAREQARKDLPLSTYTEAYWKINLWNLLHFLALRMEEHAQLEIREYARAIGEKIVAPWVPFTWEAFLDYRFNGLHFSEIETAIFRHLLAGDRDAAQARAVEAGWLEWNAEKRDWKRNRERSEFVDKVKNRLGVDVEWKAPG